MLELVGLLGDRVQLLSEGDDLLDRVQALETVRDGRGVLVTGAVQDAADAVDVVVGPFRVGGRDALADRVQDDKEADGENGLLVGNLGSAGRGESLWRGYVDLAKRQQKS